MEVGVKVLIDQKMEGNLLEHIKKQTIEEMVKRIRAKRQAILTLMREEVTKQIPHQPEVTALHGNTAFRFDLGLHEYEIDQAVNEIVSIINDNIFYRVLNDHGNVRLDIGLVSRNYSDILGIAVGKFTSKNGYDIPWLEWLLLRGHETVVIDYHVQYLNDSSPQRLKEASRSGGALMFKKGDFSVPSQYSGTEDDNFITRALSSMAPLVHAEIESILS